MQRGRAGALIDATTALPPHLHPHHHLRPAEGRHHRRRHPGTASTLQLRATVRLTWNTMSQST